MGSFVHRRGAPLSPSPPDRNATKLRTVDSPQRGMPLALLPVRGPPGEERQNEPRDPMTSPSPRAFMPDEGHGQDDGMVPPRNSLGEAPGMDIPPLVWERDVAFSVHESLRRDLSYADPTELWMRLSPFTGRHRALVYHCIRRAATDVLGGTGCNP